MNPTNQRPIFNYVFTHQPLDKFSIYLANIANQCLDVAYHEIQPYELLREFYDPNKLQLLLMDLNYELKNSQMIKLETSDPSTIYNADNLINYAQSIYRCAKLLHTDIYSQESLHMLKSNYLYDLLARVRQLSKLKLDWQDKYVYDTY